MKLKLVVLAAMVTAAAVAQAPKVALVNLEQALVLTTDGQNAEKKLDAQFGPRKAAIEAKQKELTELQDKIDKDGLTDEERRKLTDELDAKTNAVDQETTQADADLSAAQRKVLEELGPKLMTVVVRFAKSKGYDMVFDISSSEMPRMYSDATDITKDVVDEYERATVAAPPPPQKKK